jgi:multidrug efflux system membrane fusion protein
VFVVNDNKAEMRPVTVARTSGDRSVIAKGVSPGEVLVTDGQLRIVPGSAVSVKENARAGQ